ncbi:MAG: hypothetical protein ACI382_00925 [Alloprevotella sp.]
MTRMILKVLAAVMFNCVMGGVMATLLGMDARVGAVVATCAGVALGLANGPAAHGLRAGVLMEIWVGELVKKLRSGLEGSWLDGVPDNSSIVNNDVIHLVDVGIDPDVIVNNTTYPIPLQALDDKDIAVKLDKFQTKVTPVTDDELYALSYDKMGRVKEAHGNALNDAKFKKAAHALCATSDTETTPVLKCSGEADAESGRKRLTMADVVAMKRAMDKLHVPTENRRLVLCPDHVNDLLLTVQNFREQYNIDRATGKVGKLFGFDIYEYANTPKYTAAGVKKALDAEAEDGDLQCSFAFYVPRVFKATGSTKMYYSEAQSDPEYQRNKINFRHYFLCMPKKADAGVVII